MNIYQRRIPIVNAVTVRAASKIWSFFKYQTLINNKIEEMISEAMPKVKTVLQVKQKKQEINLDMQEYCKLCTKALENRASLLRPLQLLNQRNIHSHLEYFLGILEILRYSTGNEAHSFITNSMFNQERKIEQKQIFKIISLSFTLLEGELKEVIRCQILICLDSVLMILVDCSKESSKLIDKLKSFACFSRTIAYKQQYQGINQFLQLIGSFKTQINPIISELHLENTLRNLMQQLECPICQMYFTQPVSMQCGHNFCKACITSDQLIMKKCPICRAAQTDNINLSEENQFLTSILSKITKFDNKKIEEDIFVLDQDSQEIIKEYQQLLILRSKTPIKLYLEQSVEIDCKKFNSITNQEFQHILLKYPIFIVVDLNTNQSYLTENKNCKLVGKKLYMMIETISKVVIQEQLFEDIQYNENIFSYEIVNAKTEKDELIINDPIVLQNIKNQVENITKSLKNLLQNQTNDQTYQILNTFLQKCGFLGLLGQDLFQNYESMKRFTLLLPNIIRIKKEESIQIVSSSSLIKRLELLEKSIQRFKYSVSPLAVFKINQPTVHQQTKWIQYFIIILICVLVHFIEF